MKALGEFLRKAREAKGLSLQEVQEVTKIRLFFLEAIENGDFDALPGRAYIKGFLRNYAATVGVSEQEVMDRYNQLSQNQVDQELIKAEVPTMEQMAAAAPVKEKPVKERKAKTPKPSLPSAAKKQRKIILPALIIVLGIVAGAYGIVMTLHHYQKNVNPVTTAALQTNSVVKSKQAKRSESIGKMVKKSEFADIVRLEATATVWIRLSERDTGKILEEVTMRKGDTRQVKLDRAFTLLVGNAGGLKVSDKGKPFEYHGNEGNVITLTFTPPGE